MSGPLRNPFYALLLTACAALLLTIFVYLIGWYYVPHPGRAAPATPLPPWMRWIDRHALLLIAGEVSAIILLTALTIGLDRFFDPPPAPAEPEEMALPGTDPSGSGDS